MAFELFSGIKGRHVPRVSIRSTHQIGFNDAAVKELRLQHVSCVQLYFDKDNNLIGIKPVASDKEPSAVKLRKRSTGADIAAKSFLDYYRVSREHTITVGAVWDDEKKMVVLDLKDIRSQRSRKKRV